MQRYERTQHATWLWLVMVPVACVCAGIVYSPSGISFLVAAVVIVPVALVIALFSRLTIAVDARAIAWHFGWSWPGARIDLRDVERVEITHTNFLEGWGLHYTIWHGWLWNVGGFQAVEITKTDGSRVTLGTDDPQGLLQAIERFRKGAA